LAPDDALGAEKRAEHGAFDADGDRALRESEVEHNARESPEQHLERGRWKRVHPQERVIGLPKPKDLRRCHDRAEDEDELDNVEPYVGARRLHRAEVVHLPIVP